LIRKLDTSVGMSGPHDFCVRAGVIRPRNCALTPSRPSHPALNVRDDREAPLRRVRDARMMLLIWGRRQACFWKPELKFLRQIGTTGKLRMASMRGLPVVQHQFAVAIGIRLLAGE
jgi:hypothetical protein